MHIISLRHPQSLDFIQKMFDAYLGTGQIRREELLIAHATAIDLAGAKFLNEEEKSSKAEAASSYAE